MKNFAISIAAIFALALISCNKEVDPAREGRGPAVDFTSEISRASGNAWEAADKIGIFMAGAGTTTISGGASNKLYTVTAAGTAGAFTATGANVIYFPVSGASVDFWAYYPYDAAMTGHTYNVNVATQTSPAAIDLLWAKATGKDKTAPAVALVFAHKLSKLVLKPVAGTGLVAADLSALTVKVKGMNTAAAFDVSAGTLGTPGTAADITPKTITAGSEYQAIILPATVAVNTVTVEFALNNAPANDVFVWKVPATTFAAATEYEYTVTLSRTGVTVTGTITGWTTGTPGTGTAN